MRKLIAAAVGLYVVALGAVSFLWLTWTNAAAGRGQRAVALGEEHAPQLSEPSTLPDLREACHGKLTTGGTRTIAAYIAKSTVKPTDDNAYDEVVVGIHRVFDEDLVREGPARFKPTDWPSALRENANPVDWLDHLRWSRAGSPELEPTKYLVVAKYFTLLPPQNEGLDAYTRGGGTYAARVLTFPEGHPLCEGRGDVRMKDTVNASGRGASKDEARAEAQSNAARLVPFVFSLSVTTSPLHALCDAGGPALCKLTGEWVGSGY
jgi:hypothetical protein